MNMNKPALRRTAAAAAGASLLLGGASACGNNPLSVEGLSKANQAAGDEYRRTHRQGDICITYEVGSAAMEGRDVDPATLTLNALELAGLRLNPKNLTGQQTAANDIKKYTKQTQNAWAKTIGAGLAREVDLPGRSDIVTVGIDLINPDKPKEGGNVFAIKEGIYGVVPYSDQEIPAWLKTDNVPNIITIDCQSLTPLDTNLPNSAQPLDSRVPGELQGE